ncbi:MAG: hypothetical protein U1F07_00065 [Rubrivivax sp.]
MAAAAPALSAAARARLVQAVQRNCDIADARHATELALCSYLLQMREFYRWEHGLALGAALPRDAVGEWIAGREARWESLQTSPWAALPLAGDASGPLDPFDAEAVNARLLPQGLLYGAGLVGGARPVFFLAELHALGMREGLRVQQAGHELARGLAAPPAALAGAGDGPVVLRRESMARACWERYEAFALRPAPGSAFAAMLEAYGFARGFDAALPRWLDEHVQVALLHELGEHRVGLRLGPEWAALCAALPTRRSALQAAALRDQLADLSSTLPALLAEGAAPALHAWFAGYDGLREALFPGLVAAYRCWREGDGGRALAEAVARGRAHFEALATRLLDAHRAGAGAGAGAALEAVDATCGWRPEE